MRIYTQMDFTYPCTFGINTTRDCAACHCQVQGSYAGTGVRYICIFLCDTYCKVKLIYEYRHIFDPLSTIRLATTEYIQEMTQRSYVLDQTTQNASSCNDMAKFQYLHGLIVAEENKCLDSSDTNGFVVVLGNSFRDELFIVTFTNLSMSLYLTNMQSSWAMSKAYVVTSIPHYPCRSGALEFLSCFPSHKDWVVTGSVDQMIKMVPALYAKIQTNPVFQVYLLFFMLIDL